MSLRPGIQTHTTTRSDGGTQLMNGPAAEDRRVPADAEPNEARIARWMARLDRRMRQVECRLAALAGQAADQQEAIGMICTILRDLDDPYGFGLGLDERLAREGSDRPEEEG